MDSNALADWVQAQLDERGWTQADLMRASGLKRAHISNLLGTEGLIRRMPQDFTIDGLARAFNTSRRHVLTIVAEAMGLPTETVTIADAARLTDEDLLRELAKRLARGKSSVVADMFTAVADDRDDDTTSEIEAQQTEP